MAPVRPGLWSGWSVVRLRFVGWTALHRSAVQWPQVDEKSVIHPTLELLDVRLSLVGWTTLHRSTEQWPAVEKVLSGAPLRLLADQSLQTIEKGQPLFPTVMP